MESSRLMTLLAISAGTSVANLYYHQPLLAQFEEIFGATAAQVGLIPTLSQVGYALGMLLIVPLGDMLSVKRLIVTMSFLVSLALASAALSSSVAWLAWSSGLVGFTTVIPQLIIPFGARLAGPGNEGKAVGTLMSGLLAGILLARTLSGFVSAHWGWRSVFIMASVMMALQGILLLWRLPEHAPHFHGNYFRLLTSLLKLFKEQPVVREAALLGALFFGSFSVFWSTLSFHLAKPPFEYGPQGAGVFGLVGAAGALLGPVFGRYVDRQSDPKRLVRLSLILCFVSFLAMGLWTYSLAVLIAGVVLMDLGVQTGHIANQARLYAAAPGARARANTIYMFCYFVGGALGSSLGTRAWPVAEWRGVCSISAGLLGIGMVIALLPKRPVTGT